MSQRRIIAFAHRGGMAHMPENTLPAFTNAVRLGAHAVETDVWLTRDGVAVIDHDGIVEVGGVDVDISLVDRSDLPPHIPTLAEYYEACGTELDLSIDAKDAAAGEKIIEVARLAGGNALTHLWLCHPDVDVLAGWRQLASEVHLVHSAEWGDFAGWVTEHVARLVQAGVNVLNLRQDHCTALTAQKCHRAGLLLFGWDAHDPARLRRLLRLGVDGVYSNDVTMMLRGVTEAGLEIS